MSIQPNSDNVDNIIIEKDQDIDNDNNSIFSDSDDEDKPPPPPPESDESDNDVMEDEIDEIDDDDIIDVDNDIIDDDNDNIINDQNTTPNNFLLNNYEDIDDSDSDEESDDEEYLQKFDENIQQQIIQDSHTELLQHNINEINTLSQVTRDKNGIIIDNFHKTLPFITKYEKTRILGERAKQIAAGATPLVEIENSLIDSYNIALKEFEQKSIPFIIKRPLPSGGCEYWKLEDLEILV